MTHEQKTKLFLKFRDLWIDVMMVLQDNDEVKSMSDKKFF